MADSNTKRLEMKTFDLSENKPKVLLLGNGLSRAYNAASWDRFLNRINRKKEDYPDPGKINMPMPLKIILLTDNHVGSAMKENKDYFLSGFYKELDEGIYPQVRKLFSCGFDYILTTNYSYELECAAYGNSFTENRLKSIQRFINTDRAEPKYLLHTFNRIVCEGNTEDIWHIHGEARKPDSMIIGSDYYARLTSRVIDAASGIIYDSKDGKDISRVSVRNWAEAVIFGDVYVLGFGFDYCEQDLWWLLNRKANEERIPVGKTFYYEPDKDDEVRLKKSLLNVFGVVTDGLDLGYQDGCDYRAFYSDAIEDIAERIRSEKQK